MRPGHSAPATCRGNMKTARPGQEIVKLLTSLASVLCTTNFSARGCLLCNYYHADCTSQAADVVHSDVVLQRYMYTCTWPHAWVDNKNLQACS